MTGVGRPQLSAVLECAVTPASSAATCGPTGKCATRVTALARCHGASSVMIGSWFAGTHESPGDLMLDSDGRAYKVSFGMASARAVASRTSAESCTTAPARALRGGHLLVADVPRPGAPGRRGPHRPDLLGRAVGVHARRSQHARGVPRACRARRPVRGGLPRGGRSPRAGDPSVLGGVPSTEITKSSPCR